MGDGVNIAARLEGIAKPGAICISERRLPAGERTARLEVTDLGPMPNSRTSPSRSAPIRWRSACRAKAKPAATRDARQRLASRSGVSGSAPLAAALAALLLLVAAGGWYMLGGRLTKPAQAAHLSIVVLPFANLSGDPCAGLFRRRHHREPHDRTFAHPRQFRHRAQHGLHLQGQEYRRQRDRQGTRRSLRARRLGAARSEPGARQRAARRRRNRRASVGRPFRGGRGRPLQAAR